jgi:hypothetical protein
MAYMDQKRKAEIAAALKKVVPKDWKYSLAVRHHSTIVMTIRTAPVERIALNLRKEKNPDYIKINEYYPEKEFDGRILPIFQNIKDAMMKGNHNNSDIMTDYFDVGWYIDIQVGEWNKPFKVLP